MPTYLRKPMRINFSFLLSLAFVFIFISSCKDKTIIIPPYVLPQDTMTSIIVDFQLLEASKIKKSEKDSILPDSLLLQYSLILNKHNISQFQFEQSFDFYKLHPKFLEQIYEKAVNELHARQATINALRKTRADSIRENRNPPAVPKQAKKTTSGKGQKKSKDNTKK